MRTLQKIMRTLLNAKVRIMRISRLFPVVLCKFAGCLGVFR